MKKMDRIIRNIYRITLSNGKGLRTERIIKLFSRVSASPDVTGDRGSALPDAKLDSCLREAVRNDASVPEPDPEILQILTERIHSKKRYTSANSIFALPAFVFRNFELKMAALTLIIVFALGVNPSAQYKGTRNISPYSLADTLIDSSRLNKPFPDRSLPQSNWDIVDWNIQ